MYINCLHLEDNLTHHIQSHLSVPAHISIQKDLAEIRISLKHQSHLSLSLTPSILLSWSQTLLRSVLWYLPEFLSHPIILLCLFQFSLPGPSQKSDRLHFFYLFILLESYGHAKFDCSLNFRSDFCKRCYSFSSPAQVKQRHLKHIVNYKTAYKCHINVFWSIFQITFGVDYIKSSHRFLFSYTGKFTSCSLYSNEIHSDKQTKIPKLRQDVSLPWQ